MSTNSTSWGWYFGLEITIATVISCFANCAYAQITPDGTLPNNSRVTVQGNTNLIEGGTTVGSNLFHSFSQFSIPTGNQAFFKNALDIQNIITRVTGNSISNIDGLIRANGTANIFLINPNGIIFGQNASLNIGGSFLASTASSLNFADSTLFSATATQTTPLLTISVPIGLQFGANPGRILVQGNGQGLRSTSDIIDTSVGLRVQPNQTLALVGSDVVLEGGTLKTAGGRIELGSVDDSSQVRLTPIDKGWAMDYAGVPAFRDIQLSRQATVDASGEGGGDIQVQGRRVTLTDVSQIEASTLRGEPGGTLSVRASESVELTSIPFDGFFTTALLAQVYPGATGKGGNLIVETPQLSVRDGAQIQATTFGLGAAGNLIVNASESIELIGETADGIFPSALSTVVTQGATGAGGNLTIETRRLSVRDGAQVQTATSGSGAAGNLIVNASELVEISGFSFITQNPSTLTASTESTGDAGNITIETEQLTIQNGAIVSVSGNGPGNAGNMSVQARSILLNNEALLQANAQAGEGNINLSARDLILRNNSNITTDAEGENVIGGNININTNFLVALENSDIRANSTNRGGQVTINTRGIFGTESRTELTSESDITATGGSPELSGIVEINTPEVDTSLGFVELPANVADVSGLVNTGCATFAGSEGSSFVVTGRGGLPPSPDQPLSNDVVWSDTRLPATTTQPHGLETAAKPPSKSKAVVIVPATGWVFNGKGEVTLISSTSNATGKGSTPATCSQQ
ncbi:filamentous hemagglutinin N-terminal domain-containing protein [Iningainema tapete]|uniref:Filamentous hemagglutinin N-terminal domain-containing protein n=1 Tax=Iningainema tapete BLCC-T55 TaxID=2748662 RepID=A0A8J6XVX0_9CYAN|nr:filamentous hemagglutinin N-terminal domain-containing protein [Iningainema tapete]MBD2777217.1 filamentous hemagglutinin N-terminal domain-containing protein [Iningainema tapete BLCC-T55]